MVSLSDLYSFLYRDLIFHFSVLDSWMECVDTSEFQADFSIGVDEVTHLHHQQSDQ